MATSVVHLDAGNRPSVVLAAAFDAPDHHILLEELRPVVRGFCTTCFQDWEGNSAAARKARACAVMVAYLGWVNRDRRMAVDLRSQVDALQVSPLELIS